jgi:hypothetical protein
MCTDTAHVCTYSSVFSSEMMRCTLDPTCVSYSHSSKSAQVSSWQVGCKHTEHSGERKEFTVRISDSVVPMCVIALLVDAICFMLLLDVTRTRVSKAWSSTSTRFTCACKTKLTCCTSCTRPGMHGDCSRSCSHAQCLQSFHGLTE